MNARGKLAQGQSLQFIPKSDWLGTDDNGRDYRLIDDAVMVPRTGGALLMIGKGAIMVMDCGKNRAHAHVEQANDRCSASHHLRGESKLRAAFEVTQGEKGLISF